MIEVTHLPKEKACKAFDISRQSFYKWKNREPLENHDNDILESMQQIALEFPKYGYRRITKALQLLIIGLRNIERFLEAELSTGVATAHQWRKYY